MLILQNSDVDTAREKDPNPICYNLFRIIFIVVLNKYFWYFYSFAYFLILIFINDFR